MIKLLTICVACAFYILSFAYLSFPSTINKQIEHSNIRTVFVIIGSYNLKDIVPLDDNADNIRFWQEMYESALLKAGFNVITRSKINTLMEEQVFIISGAVTQEQAFKIGKLVAADAVLFVNVRLSSDGKVYENVKLVKIDTGEIALLDDVVYHPDKYKKGRNPSDMREKLFRDYRNAGIKGR